jgi:hypothetical protein
MRRGAYAAVVVVLLAAPFPGGPVLRLSAQEAEGPAASDADGLEGSAPESAPAVDPLAAIGAALGGDPPVEVASGTRRYRSNAEYIVLAPAEERSDGYILLVDEGSGDEPSVERSILFLDGVPVGGERLGRDEDGRITSRLRVDDRGETLLTEETTYRGDGTIRAVTLCREGECVTARFSPPGPFGDETIIGDDVALRLQFDADARPEYIRTEREGTLSEEFMVYREGALVERRVVTDDGTSVTTTYREGRPLREVERRSGRVVRTTENEYDPEGRTARRVEERRTERREWEWVYGADEGSYLLRERENGALVSQEQVRPDGEIERTLFRNGVAVLRETIVDGDVTDRQVLGGNR